MSEPNPVVRDVVAELAEQHPEEFADFWAKSEEQQSELIERLGRSEIARCGASETSARPPTEQ